MLVVKAGRFKRRLVAYGFYRWNKAKIIWADEILSLQKGDTAEITGTWGPHDMYTCVTLHKLNTEITLFDKEIEVLFKQID